MPTKAGPPAKATPAKAAPAKAETDGEICPECWPKGWLGDDSGASCIHGAWER